MLHAGLRLGDRYRLEARIGAGGMGEVWRAVDEVLGRVVAVKAMLPGVAGQPGLAQRFLAEAKAMARVNHPAVASIHDYGRDAGITFLVMEFIDGESLAQVLARGRLDPVTTMRFVAQAADGLRAVHERHIVHRDLKPANLLIRRDGTLLITDFGISRIPDGTPLTASGTVLGTPTYLSPEQVLGRPATGLSDIYSLGLTAYECLAGRRPFEGDNPYAVALQRLQASPRTLAGDIPATVLAVVARALATDPADRWPSAAAMADAARAAAGAGPAGQPARARAPRSRRWALSVAAILVLALVVAGGVAAWRKPGTGARSGSGPASGAVPPPGFVTCGALLCPAEPLCWAGVTAISGRAWSPRDRDCAGGHTWETFAATALPADVSAAHEDELLLRADIAAACSARVMAERSRDSGATEAWEREAWPVEVPGTTLRLVHCLARPPRGEPAGSAFASP